MKRVVVHRPGGYDRLRIEEHPDPVPAEGEVLVAVEAAGVNYADCIVRMGLYASAREYVGWPITPGFDFAGRVVGGAMEPGTPVLGVTRFGGYASRIAVPRSQLFLRPAEMSADEGAAFPSVHLTAWYALHRLGAVQPGHRVLVHSAAGGVGSALLQLSRHAGAVPIGVVGATHKVDVARSLGAEAVVDKSSQPLWSTLEAAAPDGFDLVLDANGPSTLQDSFDHLAPEGRLVVYGFHSMLPRRGGWPNPLRLLWGWLRTPRFSPLAMTAQNRSVLAFNLSFLFHRGDVLQEAMQELLAIRAEGALVAPPIEAFALDDVADAHRRIESGQTVGKLVLRP